MVAKDPALLSEFEAEQDEFVSLANTLTDEQWHTMSLCAGWTVRQVVVHVAWHIHRSMGEVLGTGVRVLVSGPAKVAAGQVARDEDRSTQSLIDWLTRPGQRNRVNLGELVIHQQDVRRPLGLTRSIPAERVRGILDYCMTRSGSASLVPGVRKRIDGLRLVATDMEWSAGQGPEVSGPAEALLMAANGRDAALGDLQGAGVATLASRMAPGTG